MNLLIAAAVWLVAASPGVALDGGAAARLLDAAARYQAVSWKTLPARASAVTAEALAARLAAEAPFFGSPFDLRAYQRAYGLRLTGKLDRPTLTALRRPAAEVARLLRVNAGRYAALPTAPPFAVVNTPSYELVLVEPGAETRRRVIVGCPALPTPLLRDELVGVALHPVWKIPERIAYEEIVPKVIADPGYLARNGMRVLRHGREVTTPVDWAAAATQPARYQFEQTASAVNPLGRLKFLVASGGDVLLHDTPAADLFGADARTFSHGCIRVEDVVGLAARLLGDPDTRRLEKRLAEGKSVRLKLPRPVPVLTMYVTAWVDAGGRPAFRPDVYGCDTALEPLACPAAPPPFVKPR